MIAHVNGSKLLIPAAHFCFIKENAAISFEVFIPTDMLATRVAEKGAYTKQKILF